MLGRAISKTSYAEQFMHLRPGKNGAVPAHEVSAHLAVATMAEGALQIALHAQVDRVDGEAELMQSLGGGAHHDLRAAQHGDRSARFELQIVEQGRDQADVTMPAGFSDIGSQVDFDIRQSIEQVLGLDHVFRFDDNEYCRDIHNIL